MKSSILKKYPPYTGSEPYVYFCFAKADEQRVSPVIGSLYKRGCRIWYSTDKAKNKKEYYAVSKRIEGASLAVVYLTENAGHDTSLKNNIKSAYGKVNIIVLRADSIKGNLSLGLPQELPSAENEEELLRTEGFNAGLIGPPPKKKNTAAKIIAAVLLAMAVSVGIWAGVKIAKGEPVTLQPESVTELRLSALPENTAELEKYPNLKKLIVPQSMAKEALERFDGYTIVLAEG